jgi:hypothetical protein
MNNQTKNSEAQCCVDYCETTFEVSGQQVVNSYNAIKGISRLLICGIFKETREIIRRSVI